MRILFLTNLYPPHGKGGYEEWCQEVAMHLRKRGHEVIVLTSAHGSEADSNVDPTWVRRELYLEMELASLRNGVQFFTARQQRARDNFDTLRSYIRRFQPELIMIWGMWNIVRSLPILAEKLLPGRVIYYMGDYWPTLPSQFEFYWKAPAQHWYTQLPKSILGFFATALLATEELPTPAFERVVFPTIFMRNELVKRGVRPKESMVIYGAADTAPYEGVREQRALTYNDTNGRRTEDRMITEKSTLVHKPGESIAGERIAGEERASQVGNDPIHQNELRQAGDETGVDGSAGKITLLWVGRLRSDKGAHIAIKALAKLVQQYELTNLELLIAGSGEDDYQTFLEYLVRKERLQPYISFLGQQQKEAMPLLYRQAHLFLFTSIWQEPFGRVLVEAMAAGTAVVGSTVGGATEILVENENSLTFPPGDVDKLAAQVSRLVRSPELRQRLAQEGKRVALEQFDIQRMAMEIEGYIKTVIRRADAQGR